MIHKVNILIHVLAGTLALLVGLAVIVSFKGSVRHIRYGRYFLYLLSIVVGTGFFGWLFFRSNSFLLMLTLLAGYVGYSGYRTIRLREQRGTIIDVLVAISALACGGFYVLWLRQNGDDWSPTVVFPTLGALALVTSYDIIKYFWLHRQIKGWWLYEHIYKMLSAYSAIFSAFIGTMLPQFKPYSQIGPSALCFVLIIYFIWKQILLRRTSPEGGDINSTGRSPVFDYKIKRSPEGAK